MLRTSNSSSRWELGRMRSLNQRAGVVLVQVVRR